MTLFSNSGYISSNKGVISEWLKNVNDMERSDHGLILRDYAGIRLDLFI
jgi:hypothetical protein